MYFFYFSVCTLVAFCVVVWMVVVFRREMKESYVDLLRVIQYAIIFIYYCLLIYNTWCFYWYKHKISLNIISAIVENIILYYYVINLFSWYLLMRHIMILHQLRNGIEYENVNRQTKSTEIKTLKWFSLIICIFVLLNVTLSILSNYIQVLIEKACLIIYWKYLTINFSFLISFYLLFRKLSVILKSNLNYYFITNWKSIRLVFLINFILFISAIWLNWIGITLEINHNSLIRDGELHKTSIRVVYLILLSTLSIWDFLYSNNKNWILF